MPGWGLLLDTPPAPGQRGVPSPGRTPNTPGGTWGHSWVVTLGVLVDDLGDLFQTQSFHESGSPGICSPWGSVSPWNVLQGSARRGSPSWSRVPSSPAQPVWDELWEGLILPHLLQRLEDIEDIFNPKEKQKFQLENSQTHVAKLGNPTDFGG